jgi:hypothetical protein
MLSWQRRRLPRQTQETNPIRYFKEIAGNKGNIKKNKCGNKGNRLYQGPIPVMCQHQKIEQRSYDHGACDGNAVCAASPLDCLNPMTTPIQAIIRA